MELKLNKPIQRVHLTFSPWKFASGIENCSQKGSASVEILFATIAPQTQDPR
jgi:hypothetical protein